MSPAFIISMLLSTFAPDSLAPLPYQHISKTNGLSNSAITSIYMDSYDYVWFGSWDGLNQYNGSDIRIYKPEAFSATAISNNIVRDFLEDKDKNLWIVTHKGINRYNRNSDSFKSFFAANHNIPFLEYNMRACLGPDSVLLVSLIGQGLNRYEKSTDSFVPVLIEGLEKKWTQQIVGIGSNNQLTYLLGNDGKLICVLNNKVVYTRQLLSSVKLHAFFQLNGKPYLALTSNDGSIHLYTLTDLEKQALTFKLSNFPISCIATNAANTEIWVGTDLGNIFKLHETDGKFSAYNMADAFPTLYKAQRKILSIKESKQDILWIGTDGDGVFKFLTKPKPFSSIGTSREDKQGISNTIVRSVYEDSQGTLFVGTRGGGLNILTEGKATKVITTTQGLSNNAVLALNKDKVGNLWIGTDGNGLDMLEHKTNRLFHFPEDFENKTSLQFGYVYSICIDAYGTLWLGTSGYGVIKLRIKKTNQGYRLEEEEQITYSPDKSTSLNSNVVYSIIEESPNILWFGTRGSGIYRYNSLTKEIVEHIHTGSSGNKLLNNDDVISLFISKDEKLWVGTSGGLTAIPLQRSHAAAKQFTLRDGLPNNTIHSIQEDPKGLLWLSTNNGLVHFNPEAKKFRNYDTNDGLQNNEFTDGASFRSVTSERLFFGGINGLDVINPMQLDTVNYFPRLSISDFEIHNVHITPNDSASILSKHIDFTSSLTLRYDQNFISFHFTTLNYWNKQRSQYAYFLENFDKDWNYIGQQSFVNLTNIPPGEYTLHINYTNENGVWSPAGKKINIIVKPPFWKTTWAYAAYLAMLIGLQIGIVLIIRQRARVKRAAAIDKFKIQQLKELNDYKLQFFTNIAHEFRTPLTLILGPVSALIKKANSVWQQQQLKTIYNNSLRLQKLLEELLQFRKIESGKENPVLQKTDLIQLTHEIVEIFQQHAEDHEVTLEFMPETEVLYGFVDVRKTEKILINLISNAIKYNVKGGAVEVVVRETDGNVIFIVKDTGVGIAPEDRSRIFENFYHKPSTSFSDHEPENSIGIGLALTKSLVLLQKGEIEVESDINKGSVFTVTIPLGLANENLLDEPTTALQPFTNLSEKVQQEFEFLTNSFASPSTEDESERSSTILVVDDHAQILILLQDILSDQYSIITAHSGQEALHILEQKKIDLVISDVRMPGIDGLTLCQKIKDDIHTSHIPVILLTAKAEIEDRIEGLQVGADSYIPKPFHPEHLFVRIEKLIKSREQIKKRFENFADVELEKISTGIGEKDDEFLSRITTCIEKHMSNPDFSADVMAEEVGMSKASLYKKVKATMGLTPHGLIKQYRLRKAADLLRNSSMSVSEVIYETGFNSRSYFYKSFNEMYHCHPKDFGGAKAV